MRTDGHYESIDAFRYFTNASKGVGVGGQTVGRKAKLDYSQNLGFLFCSWRRRQHVAPYRWYYLPNDTASLRRRKSFSQSPSLYLRYHQWHNIQRWGDQIGTLLFHTQEVSLPLNEILKEELLWFYSVRSFKC
jgi:hypothetical protein